MTKVTDAQLAKGYEQAKAAHEATLKTGRVRVIKQIDITRCPHYIMVPEHYRDDGSCKCNDPNAKEMRKWGYKWRGGQWR